MTKEEAIREELKHGKKEGMLADLVRVGAIPGQSVERLTAIADGAAMEEPEIDSLFTILLNDDEDYLED